MRWFELRSRQLNDDEYIAAVRKNLRIAERWRPWIVGGHVGLIAISGFVVIPLTVRELTHAMDMAATDGIPAWTVMAGFFSGIGTGLIFMALFWFSAAGFAFAMMPLRTDRLLLHYYDASQNKMEAEQSNGDHQFSEDTSG